jgi:ribonuclease E
MEEVQVEGDEGYKDAKNFMRVLTPSHAKRVKQHKNEGVSLFQAHKAEQQLDALFNPVVTLKSGGYLVMNQTEALVAVDVNSGKATKERSIEETALSTNLEAAEEVARQLRLRDLAGLVVIDFIDMDESRHRGQVERKLKESMRGDRARIQLGRISPFGLLELSRQRIRPSVFETTMVGCSVCGGIGVVRSSGSLASSIMRRIGDLLLERDTLDRIEVDAPTDAALKVLNEHREELANLEAQFGVRISILPNAHLFSPHFHLRVYTDEKVETFNEGYTTDPTAPKKGDRRRRGRSSDRSSSKSDEDEDSGRKPRGRGRGRNARSDEDEDRQSDAKGDEAEVSSADEDGDGESQSRRQRGKRGGRRRGRKDSDAAPVEANEDGETTTEGETSGDGEAAGTAAEGDGEKPKRRRGKRGGRNRRKNRSEDEAAETEATADGAEDGESAVDGESPADEADTETDVVAEAEAAADAPAEADAKAEEEAPAKKPRSRSRKKPKAEEAAAEETVVEDVPAAEEAPAEAAGAEQDAEGEAEDAVAATTDSHVVPEPDTPKKDGPKRRGWWSRGN